VDIARPRPAPINKERLRAALEQRAKDWRAILRGEPDVARVLLRRLFGRITLWKEEAVPGLSTVAPGAHIKKGRAGKQNITLDDILMPGSTEDGLMWGADVKPGALTEGLVEAPVSGATTR
jgi:hypothetical protein